MIRSVSLRNWKSFESATLEIEPLTVLIGLNASGKSNALDALSFLQRSATGVELAAVFKGDDQREAVRGGPDWAARRGQIAATLDVVVASSESAESDFLYSVTIEVKPRVQIRSESLQRRDRNRKGNGPHLFLLDPLSTDEPSAPVRLYNKKGGERRDLRRGATLLSQIATLDLRAEIREGVDIVIQALRSIFILDPQPAAMRDYSPLSDTLNRSGSNVAGVLAGLPEDRRHLVEQRLAEYLRQLAEPDVLAAYAEPVGRFKSDAMLYCKEVFGGAELEVDARGMSDGTLRFVAILTALLTRPRGSLLVVEEIDNGLHPSRAGLLLTMLMKMYEETGVDVLVTTHNSAFLDALPPELIPAVLGVHRSVQTGSSELVVFEDLAALPRLLAMGPLGRAVVSGAVERALASRKVTAE
jgi:predicted ATPase